MQQFVSRVYSRKVYVDEDGNRRFMLVGETGPSGTIVETESETLQEETKSETLEEETESKIKK